MDATAAAASLAALVVLIVLTTQDIPRMVSMIIYALSLTALYTTSSLYHSIPWRPAWKQRMQRLDHSMIFVLVAGSFTPIAVNVLDGAWRVVVLSVVWGVTLVGVAQKIVWPRVKPWFSITLQTTLGWFAIVPLIELIHRLSGGAIVLIAAGGLLYTVGMIFFTLKRPRLFPRVFSYHEVWHVFVISASILHFLAILIYVAPYPRG
jgi:hemolysin III